MLRRLVAVPLMTLLTAALCALTITPANADSTAPAVKAPAAVTPQPLYGLKIPPGGVFFGPFKDVSECIDEARARGLIGHPTLEYDCQTVNGQTWLVVWPKKPDKKKLQVALLAYANGLFVSAELGYGGDHNGELRARANSIGPWEQYAITPVSGDTIALQAANGKYVSAELNYPGASNGMLRARSDSVGPWEKYVMQPYYVPQTGTSGFALTAWNSRVVSAEVNYGGGDAGMLRARATGVGPWELFVPVLP